MTTHSDPRRIGVSPASQPTVAVSPRDMIGTAAVIAADIKLGHSIFALPFALLAAFMAADIAGGGAIQWGRFAGQLILIVAAMVFARTTAMVANRLIDREIDAANPRTAGRALPTGRLSPFTAWISMCLMVVAFLLVCLLFGIMYGNWWPLLLAMPVLLWISLYAFFKRFTLLCHLYLGSSLALRPPAAALAVEPDALSYPSVWLLAAMVLCWVAGFDVIYALQDVKIDREQGLHSIPARIGVRPALHVSRLLHAASAGALVWLIVVDPRLGLLTWIAAAGVAILLVYEHLTVIRWGETRLALAFFTLNGLISCVMGVLGCADVLV